MDSTAHTPASNAETAATTPASQDGSAISQNNLNARPGGHAAKQSVANAAMLFAGGSDDPFASIGAIEEEPEPATDSAQSHDLFSNSQAAAQEQYDTNVSSLGRSSVSGSHNAPPTLQIPANDEDHSLNGGVSPRTPSNLFADKSSSDLFGPPNPTGNDDWLGGGSVQEPQGESHQEQADPYGQSGHANHYSQEGYYGYAPQDTNGQDQYQQQYGYNNYDQSHQQYSEHEHHQYAGYDQSQQQAGYDQQQYAGYAAQEETGYQNQYSGYDQQQYSGYDQNQYAGYDQQSQNAYQAQGTGYDQLQQNAYQQQNEYLPQATAHDHLQQNDYQPQSTAYDPQQYTAYNGYAPQQQGGYEAYNGSQSAHTGYDHYEQQQEQHSAYDQQQPGYAEQQPTHTSESAYAPHQGSQEQHQPAYEQEQQPEYEQQDHNPETQQHTEHGAYDQQHHLYTAYDPETHDINSGYEGYTQGYPNEAGQNLSDPKDYSTTQTTSAYDHSEPINLEATQQSSNSGIEGGVEEGSLIQNAYVNEEGQVNQVGIDGSDMLNADSLTNSQEPKKDFFEVAGPTQNAEQERGVEVYNSEEQSNTLSNPYAPQYGQTMEGADQEQTPLQDRRPSQGTYSSYAPEDQTAYAPPSHTSEQAYTAYAPTQSQPEDQIYNPYAPTTQGYTPYAPASQTEDQANVPYAPPSQTEENAYTPYAPQLQAEDNAYTPYPPAGQSDDYGFATNVSQNAAIANDYSAYAPASQSSNYEQTPYGADRALSSYSGSHSGTQQHETNPGRAHIPLACFSIDGKLITYFPSSSVSNQDLANGSSFGNGYGTLHGSAPSQVTIRSLSSVISSTTYATSMKPSSCPGPLFEIGGSQISALSRATGAAASTNKNKKAVLIKHLQDAANDLCGGLSYYQASKHAFELKRQEDRILLIRILSTLLEHDGNMTNNTAFDKAVIELLLADDSDQSHTNSDQPADLVPTSVVASQEDRKVLREVEHCLIRGQRREAVTLAKDKKLWTHAVIIASGMDKDTWQDVVRSFMDETLDDRCDQTLKTAYGLFSGQDVKATYDLFRPKQSLNTFSAPTVSVETDENSESAKQSLERRKDWRRSVAMILANRSSSDLSHLTAIGDGLSVGGWLEGAHVCYLLSLPTSGIDGFDGPGGARLTLLGTHSPAASSAYLRDLDAIILTEVLEFALSLRTVPKGGEQFQGLPHLQAYRIIHALFLAEMGETKKALKYCEAITNLLKSGKMNKYYHPGLLQHLQELSDRLSGGDGKNSSPHGTGSGSWAKKKPTMDGVWGALENRFTKFIAGEDDASNTSKESTAGVGQNGSTGKANAQVGAFTHYSAITPEATSRDVSRVQSYADFSNSSSGQHPYNAYGGSSSSHAPPHSTSSNASFSRPASRASSTLDIHGSTGRSIVSPLSQAHQSNSGFVSYGNANRNPASASATMTTNSSSTEEQAFSDWPTSAGPSVRSRDHSHMSRGMDSSFDTESYEGPYKTHATRNAPWNDGSSFSGGDSTLHAQQNNGHGAEGSYDDESGQTGENDRYGAVANAGNYMPSDGQPYYGYEAHGATESTFASNVDHDLNESNDGQDLLSPMDALGGAPTPTFNTYAPQSNSRQQRHIDDEEDEDDLGFGNNAAKRRQQIASGQNNEDDDVNGEDNSSPGVTPKASQYDQKMGGRGDNEGDKSTDSSKTVDKQGDEQKQASSWFGIGRLWGSRKGTPDPNEAKATRAHMGNESSFYYDKELKRWVNKAAGDTPQAATPPPPPPRAATASPSVGRPTGAPPLRETQRAVSSSHLAGSGGPPTARSSPFSPPPRSSTSSTISELGEDGEGEPVNAAPTSNASSFGRPPNYSTLSTGSSGPRARSNLADHSQPPALQSNRSFSAMSDASATSGATGSAPPRPPPGGSMKKKPISKRYVRVD